MSEKNDLPNDFDERQIAEVFKRERQAIKQKLASPQGISAARPESFGSHLKKKLLRALGCFLGVIVIIIVLSFGLYGAVRWGGNWLISRLNTGGNNIDNEINLIKPRRMVNVPAEMIAEAEERLVLKVQQAIINYYALPAAQKTTARVKVDLTETEISALLMKYKDSEPLKNIKVNIQTVQVVAENRELEFFVQLSAPMASRLLITLVPAVENGRLIFPSMAVKFSGLPLPGFLSDYIIKNLLAERLNDFLFHNSASNLRLEKIQVESGKILLIFIPS